MGAWIEITGGTAATVTTAVAPLVGAWIEIGHYGTGVIAHRVAPLVGAWIEIDCGLRGSLLADSRSPRGSVD